MTALYNRTRGALWHLPCNGFIYGVNGAVSKAIADSGEGMLIGLLKAGNFGYQIDRKLWNS